MSEDGSAKRRRGRRGRRRRPRKGNKPPMDKGGGAKSEDIERALSRFDLNPRPMGIPAEIDPPPRKTEIRWNTNAVSREVQNKAGKIACIPGEFGFLPEERVQELSLIHI